MEQFIELTQANGDKFLANVYRIDRIIDTKNDKGVPQTYISGLTNNGGFYVKESYKEVLDKLKSAQLIFKKY